MTQDRDLMEYVPLETRLERARQKAREFYGAGHRGDCQEASERVRRENQENPELRAARVAGLTTGRALRGRPGRHTR